MSRDELEAMLRQARLAEAAHSEAVTQFTDAQLLRLQVLQDDLRQFIVATPKAAEVFDLALIPGMPPRLWLDLISSVVMAPTPRCYQLQQETGGTRLTLYQSDDLEGFRCQVKNYMAHRLLQHRKMARTQAVFPDSMPHYSKLALFYAWGTGVLLGIFLMVIALITLKNMGI